MLKKQLYFLFFTAIIALFQLSSCKKPLFLSKGNLSFSADTVVFDTVFTSIGSTTKQFKLYNNSNRTVNIEEIELMGGENSVYRINVDGVSGTHFGDLDVEGGDSLFIFVEVTLDPNGLLNPLIIEDSIRFKTNGVDQYVNLAAWGQDAYFHYKDLNQGVWPNDKPHVIYGYAAVDSAENLIIQAGTDVYLHKSSILYVYKGSLDIQGTLGNEVTFQGDRLEPAYDDVAGQYYGIYFQEALPSNIDYAIIKNGTAGIHLFNEDDANSSYTLNISNTIISNCARYGVFIYSGAKVKAENCIISKNGSHALIVLEGGDFNFNHCHLLGYGNGDDVAPAVGISNYFVDQINAVTNVGSINEGTITNSVIYGNLEHELAIDTIPDVAITLNFNFESNLISSETIFSGPIFDNNNNIWNSDPLFKDVSLDDFTFWSTSPVKDVGDASFPIVLSTPNSDILGNSRSGTPDIGAYEF